MAAGEPEVPAETDGRVRRALDRESVVDALITHLYREGNLRPGTDLIAQRAGLSPRSLFRCFEDTDDLAGEAALRQQIRALPLVVLEVEADADFDERVRVLVEQRFRLFGEIGNAALASRLRAPFHPRMAEALAGHGRSSAARSAPCSATSWRRWTTPGPRRCSPPPTC